jgi:predicted TIM-barrel fold metal-dependent hydrolase
MTIIDFHTHIFPDDLAERAISKLKLFSPDAINHTDGTTGGLFESMKKNGISRSVLLSIATKPAQVHVINQASIALQSDFFIPFGTLHPEMNSIEDEISFLKKNGIKGIKLHPEYQDFYISNPRYFPLYEQLAAEKIIVQFHAGKDPGPFSCDHALPLDLRKIHEQFPTLSIVAAHLGGWKVWDDVEKLLCGLPIFLDTSAITNIIDPQQCMRIIRKHGTEKILYGSDSPWFDQGESLRWLLKLPLSDFEKECITEKNAFNLLA